MARCLPIPTHRNHDWIPSTLASTYLESRTKMTLNPNAQAWVYTLRSGKYEQTKGHLHVVAKDGESPLGWCCLGVACDLFDKANPGELQRAIFAGFMESFEGSTSFLPQKVATWLGVSSILGQYGPPEDEKSLARDNDDGKTFLEIAEIIESEPERLFTK